MCLSLAGRILESIDDLRAVVDLDGHPTEVSLAVLALEPERPRVGDWVLVHSGLVVRQLDELEAVEILDLHRAVHGTALPDEGVRR